MAISWSQYSYHKLGSNGFGSLSRNQMIVMTSVIIMTIVTIFSTISYNQVVNEFTISNDFNLRFFSRSRTNYAVWTYPVTPPFVMLRNTQISNNLPSTPNSIIEGEEVMCVYAECREALNKADITPSDINLKAFASSHIKHAHNDEYAKMLDEFIRNHMWYKVVYGPLYPHHIQAITMLHILKCDPLACVRTLGQDDSTIVCHEDLHKFKNYDPTNVSSDTDLHESMSTLYPFNLPMNLYFEEQYNTIDLQHRVNIVGEANVEDELQGFPGIQFFPYLSNFIDKDTQIPEAKGGLFINGWFGSNIAFPPPLVSPPGYNGNNHLPLMLSMHITDGTKLLVENNNDFFRQYNQLIGSVGARDLTTLEFLQNQGIQSYLSSCFTSTLDLGYKSINTRSKTFIIDVINSSSILPQDILNNAIITTMSTDKSKSNIERFAIAHDIIRNIAQDAKVLITSRVSLAVAAMAQNIPIIFVGKKPQHLPPGMIGQTIGATHLFHNYDPDQGPWTFDIDNMSNNPGVHEFDRYRASFWHTIKKHSPRYVDTAKFYGIIPFQRLGANIPASDVPVHDMFHFIFTTPPETINWRVIRAIETVFYHHPNAKVLVHSNSLPSLGTDLDVFVETGYDFSILPYDISDLISEAPFISEESGSAFMNILQDRRDNAPSWYSHETDIVRMLLLEKFGGVYLDTDQYLVQPLTLDIQNSLGYQDPEHNMVNGAAMIFETGNPYLVRVLQEAIRIVTFAYSPDNWGIVGPNLLTSIAKEGNFVPDHLTIWGHEVFYPYVFFRAHHCLDTPAVYINLIDPVKTYTVHLNTKMTQDIKETKKDSPCDIMFKTYCLFCDEVHTKMV